MGETRAQSVDHPIGNARPLPKDESMENTNETPNPENDNDSLDAEAGEPAETTEFNEVTENNDTENRDAETNETENSSINDAAFTDPDELLAAAAAINEDPTEYMTTDDFTTSEPYTAPPGPGASTPPPAAPQFVETRLTRDPYSSLGGVLSGIAHRYGWDVALTRIAFIVVLLLSGGTAILAYLLAWVVIPRAQFWPPAQRHTSQISGRDLGIALLALAGLITIGVGSGQFAGILVPLALVGGGVWLLSQNPRNEETPAPAPAFAGASTTYGTGGGSLPPADFVRPSNPQFTPQPAPKRSRRGRAFIVAGLVALFAIPVVAIGGFVALVAIAGDSAEWEFDGGQNFDYTFTTVDEIPAVISEDEGELVIDLSGVDFSEIDTPAERIELDADLNFGKLEVILPADVRVNVDASADIVGAVDSLGNEMSGISPDLSAGDSDPQLQLDLNVEVGEVVVTRN